MLARTKKLPAAPPSAPDCGADLKARLIEGSPDCLKVLDLEGRLLSMNAGGMKVLEICDLGPVLNSLWVNFWEGEDREHAIAAVAAARAGGIGRFTGFFPTTQTRTPKWWDVTVSPILDARGRPEKLLASSRDVTRWKEIEHEREAKAAELRRLAAETAAVLEVNRAVARGLARDELFGALAHCLRAVVQHDRFGIELPIAGDRLQGHLLTPEGPDAKPTRIKILPREGTACHWVLTHQQWIVAATRAELRDRFPLTTEVMAHEGMESLAALPLITGGQARAVLYFMAAASGAYGSLRHDFVTQVAAAVAAALDNCLAHEALREKSRQIEAQNVYLQEEIRSQHNFAEIVGRSPALLEVLRQVDQVAPTDATTLIFGETGTGKELVARAIHDRSPRRERPLVKVNCGAISAGLVESELFGHVKGAFTGALAHRDGRFTLADGGTVFLDEVGELPLDTQVKLLRVLQEQEFEPIGSSKTLKVDVRVIAATNRDLPAMIGDGKFRSDLYYRLNVFPMTVPPLRERAGDVPLLTMFFLERFARKLGRPIQHVAEETMARLCAYAWPGNIRELQNVIERAAVLATGAVLHIPAGALPGTPPSPGPSPAPAASAAPASGVSLEEVERQHILAVLQQAKWRIEGASGAARLLDLQPSTLRSRMHKLGIVRP